MSKAYLQELASAARAEGRAIGAFNVETWEMAVAVVDAAGRLAIPIALQVTEGTLDTYGGARVVRALAQLAEAAPAPVALHLDHAHHLDRIREGLGWGFTSVMLDGSHLPWEENVRQTRAAAQAAHAAGLGAEGEIGHVGREGEPEEWSRLTEPEEAVQFAAQTGVDLLAVAIGTRHGTARTRDEIDLERLTAIREVLEVPLVLHGGSGVPDEVLSEAVRRGVAKVNIGNALRASWIATWGASSQKDVRSRTREAMDALGEVVRQRLAALRWPIR